MVQIANSRLPYLLGTIWGLVHIYSVILEPWDIRGCFHVDGLVHERRHSRALAMDLRLYLHWSIDMKMSLAIIEISWGWGGCDKKTSQWRHNGLDGVSNHWPRHCLLSRLFGRRSKKTLKLRVTDYCAWNSPMTGEFPAQMATNAENVSIWWCHHEGRTNC